MFQKLPEGSQAKQTSIFQKKDRQARQYLFYSFTLFHSQALRSTSLVAHFTCKLAWFEIVAQKTATN